MGKVLMVELDTLKKDIFELCTMVEDNFKNAVKSIVENDVTFAELVKENDLLIDQKEIAVEEECLKILALHQPVAADLRFIIAALKINSDLERIGDLAVNVAERIIHLSKLEKIELDFDFNTMLVKSMAMVKKSLDSFISFNTNLCFEVCAADDEIDDLNRQMFDIFRAEVKKNPHTIEQMLQYLSISRFLERVADHATNIAEDVIYMIEGDIIRHGKHS